MASSHEFIQEIHKQVEKRLQKQGFVLPVAEETIKGYIDNLSNSNLLDLLADTEADSE